MARITQCNRCGGSKVTGKPHGCFEGEIESLKRQVQELAMELAVEKQKHIRARNSLRRTLRNWDKP